MLSDTFLYKKEINKSVLLEGFGIDREYLNLFTKGIGSLSRGENRDIVFIFNNHEYQVTIQNLNNDHNRRINDAYQIRYPANGEFARSLQGTFFRSYNYINEMRKIEEKENPGKRIFIKLPEENKEYLAIYTTNSPNVFQCEAIVSDDMAVLRKMAEHQNERIFEAEFNFDITDDTAGINMRSEIVKVRKLNKKLGDSLKEHYGYRCQICGQYIGEKYSAHVVETHHIDYFVESLNNDITNLLIVCPNHHSIIHDRNPIFDKSKCIYTYPNGYKEGLLLNDHLGKL